MAQTLTPEVSRYLAGIRNTPYFEHLVLGRTDGTFGKEFDQLVDASMGLEKDELEANLSEENQKHIQRALLSTQIIQDGDMEEMLPEEIYEQVMIEIP